MTPSIDHEAIKKICAKVFYYVSDDETPEEYDLPPYYIYLVSDDEMAVMSVLPRSSVEAEIHFCVSPEARGQSFYYAKKGINWVFDRLNAMKINATIPFFNGQAYKFALSLGFELEGINKMSFLKDGQLQDQWIIGLTKGDWLCRS